MKPAPASRLSLLCLEQLETRLAPATLVDANTVAYREPDGDSVQIRLSQPVFVDDNAASLVCQFDVGSVDGSNTTRQQLQALDLRALDPVGVAEGTDIKITVLRRNGDGRADVGFIDASGLNLGDVRVAGDLGVIFASEIHSLSVHSIKPVGISAQVPFVSVIQGDLESLEVASDIVDRSLSIGGELKQAHIGGSVIRSQIQAHPIKRMTVDGSLLGDRTHPTTITGAGRSFQMVQTEYRRVSLNVVVRVTVPQSVAERLTDYLAHSGPLTQKELDRILTKLKQRPGSGPVVQVDVPLLVTRLVPVQVVVTVRTKAIAQFTVRGDAEHAAILGDFGSDLGRVQINGAFRASNISAGVLAGDDGFYGTADDVPSFAGSVLDEVYIGGPVEGTPGPDDNFGIVAAEIKSATIGKKPLSLQAGPGNDNLPFGTLGDLWLREAALPEGGPHPP